MQMEWFLGNPDNRRMIPLWSHARRQLTLSRWKKALSPKIVDNNEVSTNDSFMPLDYGSAFMHVLEDLDS